MKFGEYFRNLRNSKSVTQHQIAEVIGKNPMLISNVENNKNGPFSQDDLEKIAFYLKLDKKSKTELFMEASKASGKFPQRIWAYFTKYEKAFALAEMLAEKEVDNEQLLKVMEFVEHMM